MIDKAFKILECIAENPKNSTILAISQQTGIPKSTVHRLLTALADERIVTPKQRSGYALTPKLLTIGFKGLGQKSVLDLAVPIMRNLSELTKETVSFHVRSGMERVCIYRVEGEYPISSIVKIGDRGPLLKGSVGKVIAAFISEQELGAVIDIYLKERKISLEQVPKIREELELTRTNGYAVSMGERQSGTAALAVPIPDITGHTVAILSIATVMERMAPDKIQQYAHILRDAAKQLSYHS